MKKQEKIFIRIPGVDNPRQIKFGDLKNIGHVFFTIVCAWDSKADQFEETEIFKSSKKKIIDFFDKGETSFSSCNNDRKELVFITKKHEGVQEIPQTIEEVVEFFNSRGFQVTAPLEHEMEFIKKNGSWG